MNTANKSAHGSYFRYNNYMEGNRFCNTHYNVIDTLITYDKSTFDKALQLVKGHELKVTLGVEWMELHYQSHFVLEISQQLQEITNLNGAVAATFADMAIWAVIHKYRDN